MNSGTLRIGSVAGIVNTNCEYLPASGASIRTGAAQAHLLNVCSFDNSGMIDMPGAKSNVGVAGDVLVITGGTKAGANGGGVYISNGGSLLIDTMLNEGGANALSDTLVVDNVITGAGGATSVFVTNTGGLGAKTVGDGIQVVQLLGDSSADGFRLGRDVSSKTENDPVAFQIGRAAIYCP